MITSDNLCCRAHATVVSRMPVSLVERQRIHTSGARAVEVFRVGGLDLLAIPQLALDVPGTPANMNGGDSDTELLLLRRESGVLTQWSSLAAPGGEDAEFFMIGDRAFLAVASIRSGSGPYDYSPSCQIFAWQGARFVPFQTVPSFAAKQWKHWRIGERHFLGLAQGLQRPGMDDPSVDSVVYEWDGRTFVEQQHIPSRWAYNWHFLTVGDACFVAHADHLGPSMLYRWDGERLAPHQVLAQQSGRAFVTFTDRGTTYLVVACIAAPSRVLRFTGSLFEDVQVLDGLGGRELAVVRSGQRLFVVRINFILGTPADPLPVLDSQVYEWDGSRLIEVARFPTCGATDVAVLNDAAHDDGDGIELVVSNSLSADLRFAGATVRYALSIVED